MMDDKIANVGLRQFVESKGEGFRDVIITIKIPGMGLEKLPAYLFSTDKKERWDGLMKSINEPKEPKLPLCTKNYDLFKNRLSTLDLIQSPTFFDLFCQCAVRVTSEQLDQIAQWPEVKIIHEGQMVFVCMGLI